MYESTFEAATRTERPIWARLRLLGVVAGTLARAARLVLAPSGPAPVRGPQFDGCKHPRIVLTVGVAVDDDTTAIAKPTLERLLELTLLLRDGYENHCWLSTPGLGDSSSICREHARRQTMLARRLAARLAALGSSVELSSYGLRPTAAGIPGGPPAAEFARLLSAHRAILGEAKDFRSRRAAAARTTQQEIVVADVVATNRRQHATLVRHLVESHGA